MGTVHAIKKQGHAESRNNPEAFPRKTSTPGEFHGQSDDSLPAFDIAHAIPGRLRIVFPHLKNRREMISDITGYLSAKPGVNRVLANHFCASVTVEYDHLVIKKSSLVAYLKCMGETDLLSPNSVGMPKKTNG